MWAVRLTALSGFISIVVFMDVPVVWAFFIVLLNAYDVFYIFYIINLDGAVA